VEEKMSLIVFEGLDCVGKTSVARELEEMLKRQGSDVMYNKTKQRVSRVFPITLGYLADELINEYSVIRQNVEDKLILQDRNVMSAIAYSKALESRLDLSRMIGLFRTPDLVVYLHADDSIRQARAEERGRKGFVRLFDDLELAHRVEKNYLESISHYNNIVIDTSRSTVRETTTTILDEMRKAYISNL